MQLRDRRQKTVDRWSRGGWVLFLVVSSGCGGVAVQEEEGAGGAGRRPVVAEDGVATGRGSTGAATDGAAAGACGPVPRSGRQEVACTELRFVVTSPGGCPARGCGLVVDLHGYGMTAEDEEAHTGLAALGAPRGYIVIQPSAPGAPASWERAERLDLHPYDAALWGFVEATEQALPVDRSRLHVVGFSQGALVAFRLLAGHGERLASVVAVAGADALDRLPRQAVPLLYVHGRFDRVVPYAVLGAVDAATGGAWALGPPQTLTEGQGGTIVVRRTMDGTPVELLTHDLLADLAGPLGGHCWPGPPEPLPFRCAGEGQPQLSVLALARFDGAGAYSRAKRDRRK